MKRAVVGLVLGAAYLLGPGQAPAQSGLFLGAAADASALSVEDADGTDTGVGVSLTAGYGLGPLAPYAKLTVAQMSTDDGGDDDADSDYTFGLLDLGARFTFSRDGKLKPYVNGAYTFQLARQDQRGEDLDIKGSGFTLGGGVLLFLGPMALDAALNITRGEFTEVEMSGQTADLELTTTSARLDLGLSYFFGGTRRPSEDAKAPAPARGTVVSTEYGYDRPHGDYRSYDMDQGDPKVCRDACAADDRCKAFAVTSSRRCWLKESVPGRVDAGGIVAGVKGTDPILRVSVERGYDRAGSDYRHYRLQTADVEICRRACAEDDQCKAFTFRGGNAPYCWLKNAVPNRSPNTQLISGVKGDHSGG